MVGRLSPRLFARLPFFRTYVQKVCVACTRLGQFFAERIREHVQELQAQGDALMDAEPTDLVGAFLKERALLERAGEQAHNFTEEQLRAVVFDMWLAGQVRMLNNTTGIFRRPPATR